MKPAPAHPLETGLLTRLVERARGSEALLQRRQPSRFEPPTPWAEAQATEGEQATQRLAAPPPGPQHLDAWAPPPALPHLPQAAPRPTPVGLHVSPVVATAHPVTRPRPEPEPVAAREHAVPLLDAASTQQVLQPRASAPQPPQASWPSTRVPQAHGATERLAPPAAVPPPVLGPPSTLTPAPPPRRAAATERATAPLLRPVPLPPVRPTVPARAGIQGAATPLARHRQPAAPASAQHPAPHDAAPIQVTIGRVEVRAVTAPTAPAEPRRKATPSLSLEQYLRNRHGGRA